jgi:hypothetical protein
MFAIHAFDIRVYLSGTDELAPTKRKEKKNILIKLIKQITDKEHNLISSISYSFQFHIFLRG